jgi:hypothetical protein
MLRITSSADDITQRWTLCGQLAGPWVGELKEEWAFRRRQAPGLRPVIDLSDVTFIDESGEALLREMQRQHVEFVARGVETRHILENLAARERPQVRRFLGSFKDGGCP